MLDQKPTELIREKILKIINLLNIGKVNKALDSVSSLIIEVPNNALLYNLQGACFEANNQLSHSIKSFKKAISIFPKLTSFVLTLIILHPSVSVIIIIYLKFNSLFHS